MAKLRHCLKLFAAGWLIQLKLFLIILVALLNMNEGKAKMSSNGDPKNILGKPLEVCSVQPLTGFYRDGFCRTGQDDHGSHVVAAVVDQKFLDYTKSKGNDLQTPNPLFRFPGLKPGDRWCLCAVRWREADEAGVAPPVILEATHEKALKFLSLEKLKAHQIKMDSK
jgi:uncharacterized protein (DUF2237 family)